MPFKIKFNFVFKLKLNTGRKQNAEFQFKYECKEANVKKN